MSYLGVDLHQNSITVCRREADGAEAFETLTLSPADIERFCLSLDADDEVAIEATGNSAWFRDQVLPCAGRVVVVNPAQFKVIRKGSVAKNRALERLCGFSGLRQRNERFQMASFSG